MNHDPGASAQQSTSTIPSSLCSTLSHSTTARNTTVLLSTAIVQLWNTNGVNHQIRVMLDPGSQSHLITANCCKKIGLHFSKQPSSIKGVGALSCTVAGYTQFSFSPHFDSDVRFDVSASVVDKISDALPAVPVDLFCLEFAK